MSISYFFAIFPDKHARDLTYAAAGLLQSALGLRGKLIAPERLHMTCRFLGRFDTPQPRFEEQAIEQANSLDAEPFQIRFDHATSFDGSKDAPCVFVTREHPPVLMELANVLAEIPVAASGAVHAPFTPHVTWLRSRDRVYGQMAIAPIAWSARTLSLACSTSGQRDYRIVETWPLG